MRFKRINNCLLTFTVGALMSSPLSHGDNRYLHSDYYSDGVVTLDQGWDDEARDLFYHEPQGSPIMPYEWFLILEQADSKTLFRDNKNMQAFGLITAAKSSKRNPDALPVGLTKDFGILGVEPKLGMNCGACHVSEVSYGGQTILIDGGAAHFDFWSFMASLEEAIKATHNSDDKFSRFAANVLGDDDTDTRRVELRARLRGVLQNRENWAFRNKANVLPGPGRVDALNVILNEVTAMMLGRPDNARPSDAPVSYPFVWDTPYLDYVQYNAVVPNAGAGAMGRNVGQVLGVFGEVSIISSAIPPGYPSSVKMDHLILLEETMESLTSPRWSELAEKKILPPLEPSLVKSGSQIYDKECASCHLVIDSQKHGDLASIPVTKVPWNEVGTDPAATLDFSAREVATGPLYGRKTDYIQGIPLCERTHADQLLAHVTVATMMHDLGTTAGPIAKTIGSQAVDGALAVVKDFFSLSPHGANRSKETDQQVIVSMAAKGATAAEITAALENRSDDKSALYAQLVADGLDRHGENRACLEQLESAVYRARPLNGIWATGPYLHNGSVPSLQAMMLPPDERPTTFYVGSREIDSSSVGFVDKESERTMLFDTRIKGNSNAGHTYGTALSVSERRALLEYLKSL